MKITKRQLRKIIREEFQSRHEVIEVVDGEMGDILFFSDRPVQVSADGPSRKPDSDIGDWNALVKDLNLQPEDITGTLNIQKPGHSMYELSHDQFAALELALEKEDNSNMQREGKAMKITKRQLRRIIREAIDVVNQDSGEVLSFSDDPADIPEKAWPDLASRLGLNPEDMGRDASGNQSYELDHNEFMRLDNETRGKQDSRARKRKSAQMTADRERLNIDNLLQRLSDWAADAGRDYMADNPGVDMQDVAYDLADAWQFEFKSDEREELLRHFDGDLNDLKIYTAESMG